MVFTGDIALPFHDALKLEGMPSSLKAENWFSNLEGSIAEDNVLLKQKWVVFNNKNAITNLIRNFHFIGFSLSNNHILDASSVDDTINFLNENSVPYCGAGRSLNEAGKPLIISDNSEDIAILSFGWEVIQCEIASKNREGVNPLVKKHVINSFEQTKKQYPNHKIIVYFHWNYELEVYPQPRERELAMFLIDSGAEGIIGCHPHRIGGFEIYNEKPIIYSLGNWLFRQNYYHNGKIRFPDFCNQEVAFDWNISSGEIKFHFFEYNKKDSIVRYSHTEGMDSDTMSSFTPFKGMKKDVYRNWYKKNRYHKGKGLPIYFWDDDDYVIYIKNKVNKFRDKIIYLVVKLGIK